MIKEITLNMPRRIIRGNICVSVMKGHRAADRRRRFQVVRTTGLIPNHITDAGLNYFAHIFPAQTTQIALLGNAAAPNAPVDGDTMLDSPFAMGMFYLTSPGACGYEISGKTLKLWRTHHYYKFLTHRLVTEFGLKPTPAARYVTSYVVPETPLDVEAGHFVEQYHELLIELEPVTLAAGGAAPSPVPTITGWTTSSSDRHGLQAIGMCGIGSDGVATPIEPNSGVCNEIAASGTRSYGPGYGYCNRWKNGNDVNYVEGYDPYTDVGPLTDYDAPYNNPHDWITTLLDDVISGADKGILKISANYKNYYDTEFLSEMASYYGYTMSNGSAGVNGKRNPTFTPTSVQTGVMNASRITHLLQPLVKYEPGSPDQWHAHNLYFFDPAVENNDSYHINKANVKFPGFVQQPTPQTAPYWEDWKINGASLALSTNASALAAFQDRVDRATGLSDDAYREVPLWREEYVAGTFTLRKYGIFNEGIANRTDWRSLLVGGTSISAVPYEMTQAAAHNGYCYLFNAAQTKLNTHMLKIFLRYTWGRASDS